VVDYTKQKQKRKTINIQGQKYAHMNESIKDKRASLANPSYKFRHTKDREDLKIMVTFKKIFGRWY